MRRNFRSQESEWDVIENSILVKAGRRSRQSKRNHRSVSCSSLSSSSTSSSDGTVSTIDSAIIQNIGGGHSSPSLDESSPVEILSSKKIKELSKKTKSKKNKGSGVVPRELLSNVK